MFGPLIAKAKAKSDRLDTSDRQRPRLLEHHVKAGSHEQESGPAREEIEFSGQPLDPAIRAFMEPRLGHNFPNVRMHTDKEAAQQAATFGARVINDATIRHPVAVVRELIPPSTVYVFSETRRKLNSF